MEQNRSKAHSHTWGSFAQQTLTLGRNTVCAILHACDPWKMIARTCTCAESSFWNNSPQWTTLMISYNVKHWLKAEMIMSQWRIRLAGWIGSGWRRKWKSRLSWLHQNRCLQDYIFIYKRHVMTQLLDCHQLLGVYPFPWYYKNVQVFSGWQWQHNDYP